MNDTLYCGEKLVDLFFYAKHTIKAGIVSYIINNNEQLHMIIYLLGAFLVSLICGLVFTPVVEADTLPVNIWSAVFLMGLVVIYVIGIEDDLVGLNATTKFIFQIVTACLLPFAGLYINNLYGMFGIHEIPYWLGVPLTVFIIVFIDNAINLIDGIDGLAASLSFLALSGFLAYFVYNDVFVYTYTIIVAGMMGALVAFAYFNLFGKAERNTKIFLGDMAFVGPRPERKYYIDQIMARDSRYEQLYMLRPGVTSYATLKNGYTDTIDKMLKRLEMDLYYLEHQSLWMDVKILWKTFVNIVSGKIF